MSEARGAGETRECAASALGIETDLSAAAEAAEDTAARLAAAIARHGLERYRYAGAIRVTPLARPYSHPAIRINTARRDEPGLLAAWLHEEMHWYVTWFSHREPMAWRRILAALVERHDPMPIAPPEGSGDAVSDRLHLVVCLLERLTLAEAIGDAAAEHELRAMPFYRSLYATVLDDRAWLEALYAAEGLLPIVPATRFGPDDTALAGRMDESA